MQILKIDSSTSGPASVSRELTEAAVEHFRAKHPEAKVVYRDLATDPLPHMDEVATGALRAPPEMQTEEMKAAVPAEREVFDEFTSSEIVVIGAPMYNFSVPSQLKAWLDRLAIPGLSFSYSEAGPQGLAGGRRVIVVSAQGGMYEAGDPAEHQESMLKVFFALIGIPDIEIIRANKTGFGPEMREAAIAEAKAEIAKL